MSIEYQIHLTCPLIFPLLFVWMSTRTTIALTARVNLAWITCAMPNQWELSRYDIEDDAHTSWRNDWHHCSRPTFSYWQQHPDLWTTTDPADVSNNTWLPGYIVLSMSGIYAPHYLVNAAKIKFPPFCMASVPNISPTQVFFSSSSCWCCRVQVCFLFKAYEDNPTINEFLCLRLNIFRILLTKKNAAFGLSRFPIGKGVLPVNSLYQKLDG